MFTNTYDNLLNAFMEKVCTQPSLYFTPRNINCRLVCILEQSTAEIDGVDRMAEENIGRPYLTER